jgi:diguanylate cyclase (GGDEF)-like protein
LWLSAIFVATFAIRRTFNQKLILAQIQAKLTFSQTQALTDGLTGVWNRTGFDKLFEMNIKRGQEQNCNFSIILGDVDGLKEYNDTYGHPAADEALKVVTKILSEQCRAMDSLARYGGDEFAIFCIDIDQNGAEMLIERLCEALKESPVSMSFGAATYPIDGEDRNTILEKADKRLYAAKSKALSHNEVVEDCECEVCRPKRPL